MTIQDRAESGDAEAQHELARKLWTGDGVAKDRKRALIWYERAAESGRPVYQMSFGLILCWYGIPSQFVVGFRWILRAARRGHVGAQYFVAVEYASGEHIKRNLFNAASWYKKAANAGHAEAKYNLALMYFNGEGVDKDLAKCRELLLASGSGGELLALRALADGFRDGLFGFPIDTDQAAYWAKKYEEAR